MLPTSLATILSLGTGSTGDSTETAEVLASAGAASGRRAWTKARELYARALAIGETAEGLEGLAVASWWMDDIDAAISARERAYVVRREDGETAEAARVAGFLAWDYGAMRGVTCGGQRLVAAGTPAGRGSAPRAGAGLAAVDRGVL